TKADAENERLRQELIAVSIQIDDTLQALAETGNRRLAAEAEVKATAATARLDAARALARKRLDAARGIDQQLAALEKQFAEFNQIGRQLAGYRDVGAPASHSLMSMFRVERSAWRSAPSFAQAAGFRIVPIPQRATLEAL